MMYSVILEGVLMMIPWPNLLRSMDLLAASRPLPKLVRGLKIL